MCDGKEFVTLSPTKVEVTGFNDQDSRRLGASVRVEDSDRRCIVDTRSTRVVDPGSPGRKRTCHVPYFHQVHSRRFSPTSPTFPPTYYSRPLLIFFTIATLTHVFTYPRFFSSEPRIRHHLYILHHHLIFVIVLL